MANRYKLLAIAIAAALLVGLLAAVRLAEQRSRVDSPETNHTRPPETTTPQNTIPEHTWAATPWG